MPVAQPPHKPARDDPGAEHRLELCRLATARDERLEVSRLEIDRGGPSYSVDTLRELHDSEPGDELIWIAGGDMAASLPSWREPEAVLALATFAVADRGADTREAVSAALAPLAGAGRVTFFEMPRIDVSSSRIRARVAAGRPIRYLVPDEVVRYIGAEGLYRDASVVAA
jgi:nicotinate-nucleotide adenylyltransferase